jgi:DNA-binding MarR family transcriptional regulator
MGNHKTEELIGELLGIAHLFSSSVSGIMEAKLLSEATHGHVSPSQLKILKLLNLAGARNVSDVAVFLGVSDAAASKSVDRLVRCRYLRRTEAQSDRRRSELSLTTAGQKLLDLYENAKKRKLVNVFRDFAHDDLRSGAELLERLTKGIVNHSGDSPDICLQCGIYLQKRCLVQEAAGVECPYHARRNKRELKSHRTQIEVPMRDQA